VINFNHEDAGSTASEMLVYNHQTTRRKNPENTVKIPIYELPKRLTRLLDPNSIVLCIGGGGVITDTHRYSRDISR